MIRLNIYPGPLQEQETILVTGSVPTFKINQFMPCFKSGVSTIQWDVQTYCRASKIHSNEDQIGFPQDWDLSHRVRIINCGQFLGTEIKYSPIPDLEFTRTLYITDLANNSAGLDIELPWEHEARAQLLEHLEKYLPKPIHLVPSQFIQKAPAQLKLDSHRDSMTEEEKQEMKAKMMMSAIPMIRYPLWM